MGMGNPIPKLVARGMLTVKKSFKLVSVVEKDQHIRPRDRSINEMVPSVNFSLLADIAISRELNNYIYSPGGKDNQEWLYCRPVSISTYSSEKMKRRLIYNY